MPLTVSALRQRYGSALILEGVEFTIAPFSCMALLGRNGAGKTTLLRTLIGVLPPDGGSILFDGTDMTRAPSHLRARAGMGYVPQGREIFADLTVGQNIEIVLRNHRTPEPDAARDEVREQLKAHTEAAIVQGVFGVPSYAVDGKVFWGLDALPMLRDYLVAGAWFFDTAWDDAAHIPSGLSKRPA
jgi:ABC-type lipopolysaccharide export system ATPase subunit